MIGMKNQCFGVEVEMTGLTRGQAAQALANYFGTEPYYVGGGYDKWSVKDPDGKVWSIMSDSSIVTEMKTESGYMHTSNIEYRVEMVTPKLTYAELPRLQECVRQVRHAGAKVNHSCGIHVHVDAANHNRQSLKKPSEYYVLQGGYPVQSTAGKFKPCQPILPEGAGANAKGSTQALL